uniref:Uncharacterized protein n=2 Tax=Brassica oleracea TaxID=3712 RepID=A0A0D3CU84_BRAOL|nr:unnamed protein product [Brassica oleracea]
MYICPKTHRSMKFRGNIPTKFSLENSEGFPRKEKFRGIISEDLFRRAKLSQGSLLVRLVTTGGLLKGEVLGSRNAKRINNLSEESLGLTCEGCCRCSIGDNLLCGRIVKRLVVEETPIYRL